jgi:hypothetical protein
VTRVIGSRQRVWRLTTERGTGTHGNTLCCIDTDQARRRTRQSTVSLIPRARGTVQSFGVTYSSPPGRFARANTAGMLSRKGKCAGQTIGRLAAQAIRQCDPARSAISPLRHGALERYRFAAPSSGIGEEEAQAEASCAVT